MFDQRLKENAIRIKRLNAVMNNSNAIPSKRTQYLRVSMCVLYNEAIFKPIQTHKKKEVEKKKAKTAKHKT